MNFKKALRSSILWLLMAALALSFSACTAEKENPVADARYGTVRIFAYNPDTGAASTGTGFGIGTAGEETNYFITNWHVITSSGTYPVGGMEIYILLSNDAVTLQAVGVNEDNSIAYALSSIDATEMIKCQIVYAADEYPDVAILKADRKVPGRYALRLKSSRLVSPTDKVFSLGYPAAADSSSWDINQNIAYCYADVESVHINGGVVSKLDAFEAYGRTYCLEHDAHINHGNSGGPLVDEYGNVVGINTYGSYSGDAFLNYSVYIDYAMDYLNQLGILYDYEDEEDSFPTVAVAAGGAAVLILLVVLVIALNTKKVSPQAVDTGLRVQYKADTIMAGKRFVIKGTLRFGRAADCNILYPPNAPGISGHHCELTVVGGQVYIRDLNSSHGTFVNGSRIASNQQIPLPPDSTVSLGGQKECFQIVRSTKV